MPASYGGFVPADVLRSPAAQTRFRYSDEQLYALALYVYSLQPPPNPNAFDALAERGQNIFEREGCSTCHTPPLYTNNKLTPAEGFEVPAEHLTSFDILRTPVGTDSTLARRTRRGTGYYKVPSLKGVWYREMFPHDGSCATLEDWFDPARLRDAYEPTGFKGYGIKRRAVPGPEFGLHLSASDKSALIAFLCEGCLIQPEDLSLHNRPRSAVQVSAPPTSSLVAVERETITRVLQQTGWNKSCAARQLGLSRTQLYGRMRKFGLKEATIVKS